MTERLEINLNNQSHDPSPAIHRADSSLFHIDVSPTIKPIYEDEDELCPWSNMLTPKLGTASPRKQVQTAYNPNMHWVYPTKTSTSKKRTATREHTSVDEKSLTKSFRFYKERGGQKANENMSGEIFSNELLKCRVTPPMTRIGLVDLSSSKTLERKYSKPQLLIGSVEDLTLAHDNSGHYSGVKSRGEISKEDISPVSQVQNHFRKTFGVNLKEVETDTNHAESIKNYFKVYSQTARSLKDLRLKKGEDVFNTPNKGKVQKKILGRQDFAESISRRLESKNLYANVLSQNKKTNLQHQLYPHSQEEQNVFAGMISEGVRIVGSQRHSRNPSRSLPKREEKVSTEHKNEQEDLKDKLQILRKIRTQSQLRNSPARDGREERSNGSHGYKQKMVSPINFQKTYMKVDTSKGEESLSPRRAETEGAQGSQHYSLPQVVNSASNASLKGVMGRSVSRTANKNGGNSNEELRKLLTYKERVETVMPVIEAEALIVRTDGNEDRGDIPEKSTHLSPGKFRTTTIGFPIRHQAPMKRERTETGSLIGQDLITKSYSHIKQREATVELRTDMLKMESVTQLLPNSGTPSRLLLNNTLGRKVIKRSNFEIQAAMLQDQKVQKNVKTLRT